MLPVETVMSGTDCSLVLLSVESKVADFNMLRQLSSKILAPHVHLLQAVDFRSSKTVFVAYFMYRTQWYLTSDTALLEWSVKYVMQTVW